MKAIELFIFKNIYKCVTVVFTMVLISIVGCNKEKISYGSEGQMHDNANLKKSATGAITTMAASNTIFGNGVNMQPSYFCGGDQNLGWSLMAKYPKIKTVRIELDPTSQATLSDFKRWISEANSQGKHVIATYHKSADIGSVDPAKLMDAANWWKANYQSLSSVGYFTINLMNEWGDHTVTSSQYANAYNNALSVVRQVYSGKVICDIPGWGQEFYVAANASSLITDANIIFSAHIYPAAWDGYTKKAPTTASIDYLNKTGRPCMFGEFGSKGTGGANWSSLVDYAKLKGWAVIGWAWNGDGSSPVKMNMINPYWGDNNACGTTNYTVNPYLSTVYNKL